MIVEAQTLVQWGHNQFTSQKNDKATHLNNFVIHEAVQNDPQPISYQQVRVSAPILIEILFQEQLQVKRTTDRKKLI